MILAAMAFLTILNLALDRSLVRTIGTIGQHVHLIFHGKDLVVIKGSITRQEINDTDDKAEEPLAFSYRFMNKEYINDTYRLGCYFSDTVKKSQEELSKFEMNQEVDVFVYPENPKISVLETTKNPFPALGLLCINLLNLTLLAGSLVYCFFIWIHSLG